MLEFKGIWLLFVYPQWGKHENLDHPLGVVLPERGAT